MAEVKSDPPITDPAPPKKEGNSSSEVKRENLRQDVGIVAANILYRAMTKARADNEQKPFKPEENGKKQLLGLQLLDEFLITDGTTQELKCEKDPILLDGRKIVRITGANNTNGTYECVVGGIDSRGNPIKEETITVSANELINANLLTNPEELLDQFEGAERQVLQLHIDALKTDGASLNNADPEKIDSLTKEVAAKAGIITTDDIKTMIDALHPTQDTTLSPEQIAQNKQIQEQIAQVLSEKVIADEDVFKQVFETLGYREQDLQAKLKNTTDLINQLNQLLEQNKNNTEAHLQRNRLIESESALKRLVESSGQDGVINKYFKAFQRGEIDKNRAESMITRIRKGDIGGLIEDIVGKEVDSTNKEAEIEELKKLTKSDAAFGLLLFLFFAGATAIKAGASTLGSNPHQ